MKLPKLIAGFLGCSLAVSVFAQSREERPILKESPARLVSVIESLNEENVVAARINVAHDAANHRVRIFSIVPGKKTEEIEESGYHLEIIHNATMQAGMSGAGTYHFTHNFEVLTFAAAQFAADKTAEKSFSRQLIKRIAQAEPSLGWSTPAHPWMTIQQILEGIGKNDDTIKDFLAERSEDWNINTIKYYGP